MALDRSCVVLLLASALLSACGSEDPTPAHSQRITLDRPGAPPQTFAIETETDAMAWQVRPDGRSLAWGPPGGAPQLTLECMLSDEAEPQISIIRHVAAPPGAQAFFAVLGNGMAARMKVEAALSDSEWRWEGSYPASAAQLDVFTGPRDITATLPGGGMLEIAGSDLPRQFVQWCRNGGVDEPAEEAGVGTDDTNSPPADPPAA